MATTNGLLIIERILRDRDGIWDQIADERDLGKLIKDMLISATIALACYGAVLGAFSDHALLQSPISAVKLPLLFLVTLAICLPTLYLFNLVFGARLQVKQALALVMVAITVISMLALAFAPISLFFLITANQYSFYKLLNVAILALAATVGLRFLTAGMAALNKHNEVRDAITRAAVEAEGAAKAPLAMSGNGDGTQKALPAADGDAAGAAAGTEKSADTAAPAPTAVPAATPVPVGAGAPVPVGAGAPVPVGTGAPNGAGVMAAPGRAVAPLGQQQPHPAYWGPRPAAPAPEKQASMSLLYVWILLFGFVGTQLAWTLRPFFGSPDRKFAIFRSLEGNFYVDIVRTLSDLF